jgi:hypothetical protein
MDKQQSSIPPVEVELRLERLGRLEQVVGVELKPTRSTPMTHYGPSPVPHDSVNHPSHYTSHPSGVECIQITRWMNFNRGNAIKYIWRAGEHAALKEIEDLKKARWYIDDEIKRLEALNGPTKD